jgi:putative membrane protein
MGKWTMTMMAGLTMTLCVALAAVGGQAPATPPAGSVPSSAQPTSARPGDAADQMFMNQVAVAGMAEVEHGRLAAQNASANEVKQFGQQMVDDHGKANEELKALAAKKKVTLPSTLDAKHQAMQEKLAKLKGAAFDKSYMDGQVQAHQEAVTLFEREAKGGKDPDVKAWAEKTLPQLQQHLKMARSVASAAGK